MSDQTTLSEEERAELEQLRAEKAAREKAQAEAAQRAELEQLRAEQAKSAAEQQEAARIAAERERGRKLMEPDEDDEDIKMPVGQKLVLGVIALVAVVMVLLQVLGRG